MTKPHHDDIAARHDDIPQDALPGLDIPAGGGPVTAFKPPALRSVAFGHCPVCPNDKTGQVTHADGRLVWRDHTRTTGSGARIRCSASGTPVNP